MKTIRYKSFITLAAFLSLIFASCSKKTSSEQTFKPNLEKDTKAKIYIAGNYKNFEALEAEFDRFNDFYPNVELFYSYLDNYKSTIKSAIASDSAPDIYMTFPWMLDRPDYKDVIDSAEDMSSQDNLNFNLCSIRNQLFSKTNDGKISIIPVLSGSYGMLVNEDIFNNEKLPIPSNYQELVEACTKLKEKGYPSPLMAYVDNFISFPLIYAYFSKSIENSPEAVSHLNQFDSQAGQYIKPTLEWVQQFIENDFINLNKCRAIKDKYNAVIMTFFEGNVPLMLCDTDTVSGTLKRESQSKDFINKPFKYSFHPFPALDQTNNFVNYVAVGFSVNKNSNNLPMANEFMRFLISTEELNNLAKIKRLITTSTDYSFDEIYASLSQNTPIYLNENGLTDNAIAQIRSAVYQVLQNKMTVEEAINHFGKF